MSYIFTGLVNSHNFVWDVGLLDWVVETQPGTGGGGGGTVDQGTAGASAWLVNVTNAAELLTPASGSVSSSGNNLLITPTSGKKIRLHYCSYNPALAVEAAFRFGTAGTKFLRNSLPSGVVVVAKDFGDFKYIEGAVDESLYLNLSSAVSTIWDAFYTEV